MKIKFDHVVVLFRQYVSVLTGQFLLGFLAFVTKIALIVQGKM